MPQLPAPGTFSASDARVGPIKAAQDAILDVVAQSWIEADTQNVTISGGTASPTRAMIRADTEGLTGTDTLTNISTVGFSSGRVIRVGCVSAARVVTVAHLAGGSGQIDLASGAALALTGIRQWVELKLRADGVWEEIGRHGIRPLGTVGVIADQDQDFNGFAAKRVKPPYVIIAGTTFTPDRELHLGFKVIFTNAAGCTVTLPGEDWEPEDRFEWEQRGSSLVFVGASGVSVVNPLNHDRGYGNGACGVCWVRSMTSPIEWGMQGLTKQLAANPLARTVVQVATTTTLTTDAASTAWKDGQILAHTPGDNEKWLYLFSSVLKSSQTNTANPSTFRVLLNGTTAVAAFGRDRSAINQVSTVSAYVASYGTSPGAQSFKHQVAAGAVTSGYTASLLRQSMIGIKLEANEDGIFSAAEVSTTSDSTWTDVATLSLMAAAGDYVIGGSGDFDASSGNGQIKIRLVIDGTEVTPPRARSRNSTLTGAWCQFVPATLAAGSRVIKVQIQAGTGATVRMRNCAIYALRRAAFVASSVADSEAEEAAYLSATLKNKVTLSATMTAGYSHLVLAGCAALVDSNGSGAAAQVQLQRNGSALSELLRASVVAGDTYCPFSPSVAMIAAPALTTDAFALQWAANDTTNGAKVADAAIVVLALAPAA